MFVAQAVLKPKGAGLSGVRLSFSLVPARDLEVHERDLLHVAPRAHQRDDGGCQTLGHGHRDDSGIAGAGHLVEWT